jgi:hypothetical protein
MIPVVLLFTGISNAAIAQDSVKIKHVRQLMEASGSGRLGIQMMSGMIENYKKMMPTVDTAFWDDFMKEVKPEDLVNLVIPIYNKYFSDEEIVQLTAFYKSPIGIKLVEKLPMITQESVQVGMQWGKEISEKIIQRLREKGYMKSS